MTTSSPHAPGPRPSPKRSTPTRANPHGRPSPWSHHRTPAPAARLGERGQATAEYALVLLGAAAIALLLAAWAAQSGQVGRLFDAVVGQLIDRAG